MAEIINLPHGDRPAIDVLKPPCAVFEWKPGGDIDVEDMPGIGRWHHVPEEHFDSYVESASSMADHVGYERVYIIGRPG